MKKLILTLLFATLIASLPAHATVEIEDAFSPHQGATALVVKTINEATSSIRIAAYGFSSKQIANALLAAHNRGVDVEAVLDMKANRARGIGGYLASNGIPIRLNGHYAILHDKFMIIDNAKLELGSFNYTKSAELRNAENVIVISGKPDIVRDYQAQWTKLWNEADPQLVVTSK